MNRVEPMKSGTCSMILVNGEGVIINISPVLENLMGLQAGELVGKQASQASNRILTSLLEKQGLVVFEDQQGKVHQFYHQAVLPGDVPGSAMEIHLFQDQTPLRQLLDENERLRIENHELQLTDAITHLMTERAIQLALEPQVSRCRRYDAPLTVVMLDFQAKGAVPDSVENDARALMISRVLKDQLRWADLIARTGSNEFLIALPETEENDAVNITRKLQEGIRQRDPACVVRFGVAGWKKGNNTGDLLYRAEEALHGATSQDVA